jgi:hypothetical protein
MLGILGTATSFRFHFVANGRAKWFAASKLKWAEEIAKTRFGAGDYATIS